MTSQIVILNKQAAVAASDSAATIFRSDGLAKVFAGTQKIFPLGDWPALVMISGSAECDGVPWRTLIDDFRKNSGCDRLPTTMEALAQELVNYLEQAGRHFSDERMEPRLELEVERVIQRFANELWDRHQRQALRQAGRENLNPAGDFLEGFWPALKQTLEQAPAPFGNCESLLPSLAPKVARILESLSDHYAATEHTDPLLIDVVMTAFRKLSPSHRHQAAETVAQRLIRPMRMNDSTIVICGFGHDEIFPSLARLSLWGRLGGILRRHQDMLAISDSLPVVVVPLAHSAASETMLYGSDPEVSQVTRDLLAATLADFGTKIMTKAQHAFSASSATMEHFQQAIEDLIAQEGAQFLQMFQKVQHHRFEEMADVFAFMGEEELARIARHMIYANSWQVRLSEGVESVGGTVVAAIVDRATGVRLVD